MSSRRLLPPAAILLSATAVSMVLSALGAPVPFLCGGLVGAWACAVVMSVTVETPRLVDSGVQGAVGGLVGLQFQTEALRAIAGAWFEILVIVASTIVLSVACGLLLVRGGISRRTAAFSAVAGGAAGVVPLARDLGGDDRVVGALQYLRVALIVILLPLVVPLFPKGGGATLEALGHEGESRVAFGVLFVTSVAAACAAVSCVDGLNLPIVLVGLLMGWATTASPLVLHVAVPGWLAAVVFLLMGAMIGARFTSQLGGEVLRLLPRGVCVIVLVLLICGGLGALLSLWTDRPLIDGYLATTPGGLPAVLAAGTATGADTTFVASAQIVRLLAVLGAAPVLARMLFKKWDER